MWFRLTNLNPQSFVNSACFQVNEDKSRRVSPYFVPRILHNLPSGYVAIKWVWVTVLLKVTVCNGLLLLLLSWRTVSKQRFLIFRYRMMGGAESASTACATGIHCIGVLYSLVTNEQLDIRYDMILMFVYT